MPADAWTIPRLMARRREADAALPALVSEDGSIGWGALDAASRALAARLVRDGVAKGDRVGLLMPNGIDWASAALAVMRVGAVTHGFSMGARSGATFWWQALQAWTTLRYSD